MNDIGWSVGLMKRMRKLGLSLIYLAQVMKDESIKINPTVGYTDLRSKKGYTYTGHIRLRCL